MSANITYGLTTTQRIKDRLAVTVVDATLDNVYKRMIYAATDFIEKACGGRRFLKRTISQELYSGSQNGSSNRQKYLILRNAPVASITLVEQNVGSQATPSWVTVSAEEYELDIDNSLIFQGGLTPGTKNYRITYVAGYLIDFSDEFNDVVHTLPYELTDLCERLTTKLIKRRESEGRASEGFNSSQITWGDFLEEHDRVIIANYRRAHFV